MPSRTCGPALRPPESMSLGAARRLVRDLHAPNPAVYFLDFGLAATAGHALLVAGAIAPAWLAGPPGLRLAVQAAFLAANVLCWYRAALFVHELAHLRPGTLAGFRLFYHALFGVPCLVPSFVYDTHAGHHRGHYGTRSDAEYLPLELLSRWTIVRFIAQSVVVPAAIVVRFLLLGPLGWLLPGFRRLLVARGSSLVFDLDFVRPQPSPSSWRTITLQEAATFGWLLVGLLALGTVLRPWAVGLVLQAYLAAVGVAGVNAVRSLTSHRWAGDHEAMTWEQQLLDSTNFAGRAWLDELWAPVGQRFHATHHLFPALPYHNLAIAHRRLMEALPPDAPYRRCCRASVLGELADLWRRAGSRRPR